MYNEEKDEGVLVYPRITRRLKGGVVEILYLSKGKEKTCTCGRETAEQIMGPLGRSLAPDYREGMRAPVGSFTYDGG